MKKEVQKSFIEGERFCHDPNLPLDNKFLTLHVATEY